MSDERKLPPPDASRHFKKAHDATKLEAAKIEGPRELMTKQQLEELEKQRSKPAPQMHLRPPGMGAATSQVDHQREERIKRMRKELDRINGRARDDFGRATER